MMKLFNWCYKSAGVWALGITICLFGLTFLLITPVYDQPDDATMGLVVSGYGNVDGPDEHLIYSNVLIGLILKQLYSASPLIPWYGAYLLLVQFLSHWVLLYALLLLNRDTRCILGYLLFYLVVGIYCLTHTQFTTTAFLAGMAGLAVILSSLFLDSKGTRCRWLKWIGALLLIVSSLIRYPSFQLLILASVPLVLVTAFQFFKVIPLKSYLIPAAVAVIGVLGCKFFDTHYYQVEDDWRNFISYHAAAANVSNYVQVPYTDETRPVFESVGWSLYDYLMVRNFNYLDSETFSSTNLRNFKMQASALSLRKHPQVMKSRVVEFKAAFSNPISIFCFVTAIFFACLNQKGYWQRSIVKWLLIWNALIMSGMIIYLKLPERVFIPLCAFPLYYSLLLNLPHLVSQIQTKNFNRYVAFRLGVLLFFLAGSVSAWGQVKRSEQMVKGNVLFKNDLKILKEKWPDKVFLTGCSFPVGYFFPLDNQSEFQDLKCLYLTGRQRSPLFQQKLKAYGIQSPYTDLYETDRLYLILDFRLIPLFKLYMKQHYDVDLEFEKKYERGRFHVYRVSVPEIKKSKKIDTAYSVNEE